MSQEIAAAFAQARPIRPMIDAYEEELFSLGRVTPAVQEALRNARKIRRQYTHLFYIAGALTDMSEEVKRRYARLSKCAAAHPGVFGYAPHLHGTDPVKHPNVSPQEVRDIDYLWAAVVPDCHLNFLAPIAHGNAIEAGWAELNNIPAIHIVPEGMTASRLVRGMHNIIGTITYKNFQDDALPQIEQFLTALTAKT